MELQPVIQVIKTDRVGLNSAVIREAVGRQDRRAHLRGMDVSGDGDIQLVNVTRRQIHAGLRLNPRLKQLLPHSNVKRIL